VYKLLTGEAGLTGAQARLEQIDASQADGFATAGFMAMRMHLDHVFGRGVDFVDLEGTRPFGDGGSPFHGLSDHVPLITRFEV
jgi:endonuclease/exonuclease/phosphatase (EEP) superfamily protein YafD